MQCTSEGFARMTRRAATALLILAAVSLPRPGFADPLAVVDAYVAAWNAHDAAAAAGHLAEDVTYYDASVGTPQLGRDAARTNVIEAFLNAAPDAKWERIGDPVVTDHAVAFEWVFSGTNTGAWADGTAATGKPFEIRGLSLFRIEGDAIAYQGDYYDALGFFKQLGLN
jgi:steroid delta-isomerase-like uncharacterized protein